MASSGTAGYGAALAYGAALGSETTDIAQITDVNWTGYTSDDVDITNQDSSNGIREFLCGLTDPGNCEWEMVFKKAELTAAISVLRANKYWKITLSDTSTIQFYGYWADLGVASPLGDAVKITGCRAKVSGSITFTAAA